jgi:tetratricopeptide (TPR) repeat protein
LGLKSTITMGSTTSMIHPLARVCWWRGRGYYATGHSTRACLFWRRALQIDGRCVAAWHDLLRKQLVKPSVAYQVLNPSVFTENHSSSLPSKTVEDVPKIMQQSAIVGPTLRFTHLDEKENKFSQPVNHAATERNTSSTLWKTRNSMDWLYSLLMSQIEVSLQDPAEPDGTDHDRPINENATLGAAPPISSKTTPFEPVKFGNSTPSFFGTKGLPSFSGLDVSSIYMASPVPNFRTPKEPPINSFHTDTKAQGQLQAPEGSTILSMQDDVDASFARLWSVYKLRRCPHVLATASRRAYRRCEWKKALMYCRELQQLDPSLQDAAFCYIATLVVLGHKRVLFSVAHAWVEAAPRAARSWFAVGAYYYSCERYHVAQRHFCRATRLDPQCTEAWIAFGCAFAACDESDQALASFRAAQRLSPGEHHSLLYMGMEYVRTNHLTLAEYFLLAASRASDGDPLCLHELGVLALQKGDPASAVMYFERALRSLAGVTDIPEAIELCVDPHWEPILFNLGHCYRKTRRFDYTCLCYARCTSLRPDKYSTYSALAFTYQLMGDTSTAVEYYHQALSVQADDPFSTEMMNRALQDAISTTLRVSDTVEEPHPVAKAQVTSVRKNPFPATVSSNSATFELDHLSDHDETSIDVDMSMN